MLGFLRNAATTIASAIVLLYLFVGALWFVVPYVGYKCPPLDTHTIIVAHNEGLVHDVVTWILWPRDISRVEAKAREYGIPFGAVRNEEYCPRDNDDLHQPGAH